MRDLCTRKILQVTILLNLLYFFQLTTQIRQVREWVYVLLATSDKRKCCWGFHLKLKLENGKHNLWVEGVKGGIFKATLFKIKAHRKSGQEES